MSRRFPLVVLVGTSCLGIAACTSDSEPDRWGPLAVVEEDALLSSDGLLGTGRLSITEDCVTLTDESGIETSLVWRDSQVAWDADGLAVVFDGLVLRDGAVVQIAGSDNSTGDRLSDVGSECPAAEFFVHEVVSAE